MYWLYFCWGAFGTGTKSHPGFDPGRPAGLTAQLLQLFKLADQALQGRALVDIVNVDVADDTLLVDDEEGPLTRAVGAEHPVRCGHPPVRVEVGEHREPELAHLVCPGVESGDVVHGDPKQRCIILIEEIHYNIVTGPLVRAHGRPGGGDE